MIMLLESLSNQWERKKEVAEEKARSSALGKIQ
jgi:hypothetical protein